MIIAIGYRVRTVTGTQFRKWATETLKDYMVKGFALNDDLLKRAGGGNNFKELLSRIRDIRSSEKVFWRQVLDIYATSIDYDPKAQITYEFFKTIQNKMHRASHGHTTAEIIMERADAKKPYMGMTNSFENLKLMRKFYRVYTKDQIGDTMVTIKFENQTIGSKKLKVLIFTNHSKQPQIIPENPKETTIHDRPRLTMQEAAVAL